ncbi:hypothetical protein Nepgr_016310 [Nepenthes gracilis]|uniref:Uncharacterized protein n=1 Tax=Nepenthes gracilis TaxID=150966 RepID=A0AAD3SPI3_NEPGR|nr:hypothetical protein Nepgr_016310 [Nepenthes gracilis]
MRLRLPSGPSVKPNTSGGRLVSESREGLEMLQDIRITLIWSRMNILNKLDSSSASIPDVHGIGALDSLNQVEFEKLKQEHVSASPCKMLDHCRHFANLGGIMAICSPMVVELFHSTI